MTDNNISPIVPFVIPSGRPDEKTVRTLVGDLAKGGFEQFMLYPSTGVEYEYLSEEYFNMVEWFLSEAKARRIKVWLYDEFNWPSGTCKGRIPEENEECLYRELVACKDSDGSIKWEIVINRGRNVDNYCLDTNNLEPASANRFIELTHHAYEKRFKHYMGNVIQGIFTDEPGHCSGMWSVKIPDNAVTRIPWWSGMEDEYSAATGGRDFKTDYQEAYANGTLAQSNVLRIWTKLRSERYRRTFFDPIRNWCNANGIISTGHLVSENNPADCARVNGSPINTLLGLSKPGIDLITTDTGHSYEWITLALAQTCARRKGICSSAELFGLGPCDISLTTIRKQYWICALHGIDTFFQGLWHRTAIRFHKKPAWAMFTSPEQPWYFQAAPLLNKAAREAAQWAQKKRLSQIALVYPQETFGACSLAGVAAPNLPEACRELTWNGFNYDLIEENEKTSCPIVLEWTNGKLHERNSNTSFKSFDEMLSWLETHLPNRLTVRDTDGKPIGGYLVREFEDSTGVAINLTSGEIHFAKNRAFDFSQPNLISSRDLAKQWDISLNAPSRKRIWFWTSKTEGYTGMPWEKNPKKPTRQQRYDRDNISKFTVEGGKIKSLRFVKRNTHTDTKIRILLDGNEIAFTTKPAKSLTYAYNEIYAESEPLELAEGQHILELQGARDDKMFLPVLWMTGDFSEPRRGIITPIKQLVKCGSLIEQQLPSFAGTITYSAEVKLKPGEKLAIDSGDAVVSVKLAGRDLGLRAWAPFEWDIPSDLAGRLAKLEISVTTSVRPIFGFEDDPDACLGHAQWARSIFTSPPPAGLKSCKAIYEPTAKPI